MSGTEQRRYPRISHISSQQIIRMDSNQDPRTNLVLTRNLSATGICFSSAEKLDVGTSFLIFLNDLQIQEITQSVKTLFRVGDHYLAQVVRLNPSATDNNQFEIGAAFIERSEPKLADLDEITELLNARVMSQLNLAST